ncbi:hypothetical protein [Methylobacterium iners]|jgi:hypothetical protein|uniref:Uncharacterized protein n=1 Tax=Methylobacterium iners TaxID=418707 RepID=A0ABQ4S055_9HYPH|nr:hypothetical protein [Methylobacterium iners]GJD96326.1 hypothetical protein OCOJLMKI_3547 [Methylobacterium iners]
MAKRPTTAELYQAKLIPEEDVVAAVEAFMANPNTSAFLMGHGYALDLHAAVAASPFALGVLATPDAKPASKRIAVRTAILLARPV